MADPCPECGADRIGDDPPDQILVDNLPMHVNLGMIQDWSSHIGTARVVRDGATGCNKIEITLDENSSKLLGNMVEAFDLKAVGFAGIKRLQHERSES